MSVCVCSSFVRFGLFVVFVVFNWGRKCSEVQYYHGSGLNLGKPVPYSGFMLRVIRHLETASTHRVWSGSSIINKYGRNIS